MNPGKRGLLRIYEMCSQKQRCKKDLRKNGQRFRERVREERLSVDLELQNFGNNMVGDGHNYDCVGIPI